MTPVFKTRACALPGYIRQLAWLLIVTAAAAHGVSACPQTAPIAPPAPSSASALPVFEVASIRPDNSDTQAFRLRFTDDGVEVQNASLLMIIRAAHGMFNSLDDKFIGIPEWAKTQRFDIEARVGSADVATFKKLNFNDRQRMVQAMLTERFQLRTHAEIREQPVFNLVVVRTGALLQPSHPIEGSDPGGTMDRRPGRIAGSNVVVSQLVSALTQTLGRIVVDKTSLPGKFDFVLSWDANELTDNGATPEPSGASIYTAIQEQLGLKLEPARSPVECLVIDHVANPSPN